MRSRRVQLKRRLATVAGLAALLVLVPMVGASAASTTRQVQVLDDCDPATFTAAIGAPGAFPSCWSPTGCSALGG